MLVGVPLEGPARLMLDVRWSCPLKSGRGLEEGGEIEFCVEFLEWKEMVLLSDGANGLAARGW